METLFRDCSFHHLSLFLPTQECAQAGAGQGQEMAFCCIITYIKKQHKRAAFHMTPVMLKVYDDM
jgi:hypothetical protein